MTQLYYSRQMLRVVLSFICCLGICCLSCYPLSAATPQDKPDNQQHLQQVRQQLQLWAEYLTDKPFLPGEAWPQPPDTKLSEFLIHLKRLDEGDTTRIQAIALARKYANPSDLVKEPEPETGYHHHAHARLQFAWGVLIETKCLRPGLRLEEAVAILGAPTHIYQNNQVEWYYSSGMHVNPVLRCTLKNGRVDTIEIDRR